MTWEICRSTITVMTCMIRAPMAIISSSTKYRWKYQFPNSRYRIDSTMEIMFPILWQIVPYMTARSGRFSPRLRPQSATAATCMPSPKENDRFMTFMAT